MSASLAPVLKQCGRWSLLLLLWSSTSGCHTPGNAELRLGERPAAVSASAFPGASRFLSGFDGASADAVWRAGDEVLFGLRLKHGERTQHWLLHVRLTEPEAIARQGDEVPIGTLLPPVTWTMRINDEPLQFPSRLCRVLVTVCDEDGTVLGRSEPLLPWQLLAYGLDPACQAIVARRGQWHHVARSGSELDMQPFNEALICTVAMLQIVQEDEVLAPLLWEVVQRPSWWSFVKNLGARVVLRPTFHELALVAMPNAAHPTAFRVPMSLLVNDQEALRVEVYAAPAARPLALCGGIVGATARHPADAELEFSLLLLAAHSARSAR